jgi:hypothetical protein
MLILFDQGTPVPLRRFLAGHTVKTAAEQGWSTLANGSLLDAAEAAKFEVLVTTDKNLPRRSCAERGGSRKGTLCLDFSRPYYFLDNHP